MAKKAQEIQDRIIDFRRVKASELIANPKNWRKHPEKQKRAMEGILAEVGYVDALLARELPDGSLELVDGHLRQEVSPDAEVPVLVVDLDEAEAAKVLATFDPISAMAEADDDLLRSILEEVQTKDDALSEMLADLAEENGIIGAGGFGDEVEIVEDEVPEIPDNPITQKGDLWILGDHRLLCGDSRDANDVSMLMNGLKINVAITSPPYASQRKYDEESGFKPIHPDDYVEWFDDVQSCVANNLAEDGSWFVNIKEHCEDGQRSLYVKDLTIAHVREWGWNFVDEFVWTHGGTPKSVERRFKNGWEPIFMFARGRYKFNPKSVRHESNNIPEWGGGHPCDEDRQGDGVGMKNSKGKLKGSISSHQGKRGAVGADYMVSGLAYPSNVISVGKNREAVNHPAAYPTSLPAFFIKAYSDNNDIIYDPFVGSGTTIVSAEQLNRSCYGTEISPEYCDVIIKRWQGITGKTAILESTGEPFTEKQSK